MNDMMELLYYSTRISLVWATRWFWVATETLLVLSSQLEPSWSCQDLFSCGDETLLRLLAKSCITSKTPRATLHLSRYTKATGGEDVCLLFSSKIQDLVTFQKGDHAVSHLVCSNQYGFVDNHVIRGTTPVTLGWGNGVSSLLHNQHLDLEFYLKGVDLIKLNRRIFLGVFVGVSFVFAFVSIPGSTFLGPTFWTVINNTWSFSHVENRTVNNKKVRHRKVSKQGGLNLVSRSCLVVAHDILSIVGNHKHINFDIHM